MTAALKISRAKERVIRTTQDALSYLRTPDQGDRKRKAMVIAAMRGARREALDALPALVGRVLERTTRTGRVERHKVSRRDLGAMRAVVDAVHYLAEKRARTEGSIVLVVPLTRGLGAALSSRHSSLAPRTWSRWLPLLSVAGVLMYQHGQCRHPSLVGLPMMLRTHGGWAREALARDLDRHVTRGQAAWWAPLLRTLTEDHGDAAAAVLSLEGYREEYEAQRAQKQADKDRAIVENIRTRDARAAAKVAAEAAEEARRMRQWAAAKDASGRTLQQELGAHRAVKAAAVRAKAASLAVEARAHGDAAAAQILEIAARRPASLSPQISRCHEGNRNGASSTFDRKHPACKTTPRSEPAAPRNEGSPSAEGKETSTPSASAAPRDRDGVARLLRLAAQASAEAGQGGGSPAGSTEVLS